MKRDNPIEEIWRIRDRLGAEEGYDVHRLFDRLRREQQACADRLVQPPPRRVPSDPVSAPRDEPLACGGQVAGSKRRGGGKPSKSENPIEEVRRIREEISAEGGYDLKRLVKRLRALEAQHPERLVSFGPRKPDKSAAALHEEQPPYGQKARRKS